MESADRPLSSSSAQSFSATKIFDQPFESQASADLKIDDRTLAEEALDNGQRLAEQGFGNQSLAGQRLSDQALAGQRLEPGQEPAGESSAARVFVDQLFSNQADAEQANAELASAGQASAELASAELASTGQAIAGQAIAEQASAELASAGQASAGQIIAEQASAELASAGQASAELASAGQASAGLASAGQANAGLSINVGQGNSDQVFSSQQLADQPPSDKKDFGELTLRRSPSPTRKNYSTFEDKQCASERPISTQPVSSGKARKSSDAFVTKQSPSSGMKKLNEKGFSMLREPEQDETEYWSYRLFGCCEEPALCCATTFFPCYTVGRNAAYFHEDSMETGIGYCLCLYGVGSVMRWRIRQHKRIKGHMLSDVAVHIICPCCALVQENRELYGSVGSHLGEKLPIINN